MASAKEDVHCFTESRAGGYMRKLKKLFRTLLIAIPLALLLFVMVYALDSKMGGYWPFFARDGRDQMAVPGWAMTDAILWQPRFGQYSLDEYNFLGSAFAPVIELDRKWFHKSHYMTDTNFDAWFTNLPVSQVHPLFRDEYITRIINTISRDTNAGELKLTFRLTGSTRPREITEIELRRPLAETLGASAPAGFAEKPYNDAGLSNRYVRWVGRVPLLHDQDISIAIPAKKPMDGSGYISYSYRYSDNSEDWVGAIKLRREQASTTN